MVARGAAKVGVERILGLDIGANSVGWALVEFEGGDPKRLIGCGVRAFDAGVEGNLEQGKEESKHAERRGARLRRRQTKRQSVRMFGVARMLQRAGLLPAGDISHGRARHKLFEDLDRALMAELYPGEDEKHIAAKKFPYLLRARALDERLSPHALGRALYHLAMRRGFLSNRKGEAKKDEDLGEVKSQIGELSENIQAAGARTLGEYFAKHVDPVLEKRIRKRWTARAMYWDEFRTVWSAQERHHPEILTQALKKNLRLEIFYQRPLKSQRGLIGKCDLEPGERRAAIALLPAQRFRLLQKVNDLCVVNGFDTRELTAAEKKLLADTLEQQQEMSFAAIRKLLKIKEGKINLEEGGEKRLKGNVTQAKLKDVFGPRWDAFAIQDRQQIVSEVMGITKEETLERRGCEVWGLNAEEAKRFAQISLEPKHLSLSKKAIVKLLPRMEEGISYMTARAEVYGADDEKWQKMVCDQLPPLEDTAIELRNPAVNRALTEVRKVVNAIIRKWDKPDRIRIELARDLRQPKNVREERWKKSRNREKEREKAKREIEKCGVVNPSRADIEKYLLAEECQWTCPYTGKAITRPALFGNAPQFDVEHIWPFDRTLDDSFVNKTLCFHEENRSGKRNRTPYEAYHGTDKWEQILGWVDKFHGDGAKEKQRRFRVETIPTLDDFTSRQLNDTRYASRLAGRYLGLLYGEEAAGRIEATTGQITAMLRGPWELNKILGDGTKNRDDHRHHAIDAIATTLVDRGMVKKMSRASQEQFEEKGRTRGWWNRIEMPWDGFREEVEKAIAGVVTSHRVNRRVRGRLHEDTNYTKPRAGADGKEYVTVRKALSDTFSQADVDSIVDEKAREVVQAHLDEHGGDSKKAFNDPANHPRLTNGLPVHRVRIRKTSPVFSIGQDGEERFVAVDTNHHIELFATAAKKWEGRVVNLFEAQARVYGKERRVVIDRTRHDGARFVCSLGGGEVVRMKNSEGEIKLYLVRGVSEFTNGTIQLSFQEINDARQISKVPKKGRTKTPNEMMKSGAEKVSLGPLGEVSFAND